MSLVRDGDQCTLNNGNQKVGDAAQSAMRQGFSSDLQDSLFNSLIKGGMSPAKASVAAASQSKTLMQKLAALHEPDMVAGVWLHPDPTSRGVQTSIRRLVVAGIKVADLAVWTRRRATLLRAVMEVPA